MTTEGTDGKQGFNGAGAALEHAVWSLSDQVRTIERTDGKSERAITLAVAILALFSGALTFQLEDAGRAGTIVALGAATVVAGCFVAAVWFFFRSYAAVNWHLGPETERLLHVSSEHAEPRVRQWLAEQILAPVEANALSLEVKTTRSTRLFRAVMLEAIAAGIGVPLLAVSAAT